MRDRLEVVLMVLTMAYLVVAMVVMARIAVMIP